MAIKDGEVIEADDLMSNFLGKQFHNYLQAIWNADYIGWNAKLNYDEEGASGGSADFTNLHWDNFNGNGIGVDSSLYMVNDNTNKVWYTFTDSIFVVIEADDTSVSWSNNNCSLYEFEPGKWLLWCTTGTDTVKYSQIHKSLWYGTDGTDQLVLDFTNITAIKTPDSDDVGKRAFYHKFVGEVENKASSYARVTNVFDDTSTNTTARMWGLLTFATSGSASAYIQYPESTGFMSRSSTGTDDNFGVTYTTKSNPADWKHNISTGPGNIATTTHKLIILCKGDVTLGAVAVDDGEGTQTLVDFVDTHSIPLLTAATALTTAYIISDATSATVTNGMSSWNSTIDGTSTEAFYLSADGGSNWEAATKDTIKRLENAGSSFKVKWEVTRSDTTKKDTISEYGVLYNVGAGSG